MDKLKGSWKLSSGTQNGTALNLTGITYLLRISDKEVKVYNNTSNPKTNTFSYTPGDKSIQAGGDTYKIESCDDSKLVMTTSAYRMNFGRVSESEADGIMGLSTTPPGVNGSVNMSLLNGSWQGISFSGAASGSFAAQGQTVVLVLNGTSFTGYDSKGTPKKTTGTFSTSGTSITMNGDTGQITTLNNNTLIMSEKGVYVTFMRISDAQANALMK